MGSRKTVEQNSVEEIIRRAVEAGRQSAERSAKDAFKATERRLYGLPTLELKYRDDLEKLAELKAYGPRERDKSITRFFKTGVRLTKEEIFEAQVIDLEAKIASDKYEIDVLHGALRTVQEDEYYPVIPGRYFKNLPDDAVADGLHCDTSTVWRNRKRLVQRMAVWLYGAEAVR